MHRRPAGTAITLNNRPIARWASELYFWLGPHVLTCAAAQSAAGMLACSACPRVLLHGLHLLHGLQRGIAHVCRHAATADMGHA
mmetsp:Transcript_25642/g.75843  ORF Transcript_25642/g.75843 Transcript_25642/m.75843 type:complete len:84 (+) Transcript_25642:428-679(+)